MKKMCLKIKKNTLLKLKKKTWYYETSDSKKRCRNGYPAGGFLDAGESLIVCEVRKQEEGVIKIKSFHSVENTVYMIINENDSSYFFELFSACN